MLTVRPTTSDVAQAIRGLSAGQVAWALFWTGIAALYLLVFLRIEGIVPLAGLVGVFALFHMGLIASVTAFVRTRRRWFAALLANGAPVALFWFAASSVPAFLALYR
ncbi:MAG: hypothetical protein ACYC2H_04300 [Thermoplasmatota archaeon]